MSSKLKSLALHAVLPQPPSLQPGRAPAFSARWQLSSALLTLVSFAGEVAPRSKRRCVLERKQPYSGDEWCSGPDSEEDDKPISSAHSECLPPYLPGILNKVRSLLGVWLIIVL